MTRSRFARRLRATFFLKVLLVFAGGFTALIVYGVASFWLFDWQQERLSVRQTARNYGALVLDRLPDPPDTVAARALSERLGVGMRIEGPGVTWASAPTFPDFSAVDIPSVDETDSSRAGYAPELGFGAEFQRGEYRYLFALQAGRTAFGSETTTEEVADLLFMAALLACMYLAIRHLLKPVRELTEGVERLRRGDLNVEMRTRRSDELGRLMTSFNEMAEAVRERIRARDQLLLDVSHEIRSPLTRMRVALEMMPDGVAKESVIEDIEETEAMIAELLETERLDSPHGGLSLATADLAALVREAVEERAGQEPGIELELVEEPLQAEVDAERVHAVVGNLVSNALRHSAPDGPAVRVRLAREGESAVLSVRDCGEGIAEDDLPRIFEPFYRVDRSRSKETGGYGIGLSLVKRIVEAHGGSIEVESRLGEGTGVRVVLPVSTQGHGPTGADG